MVAQAKDRFTAWLTTRERDALRAKASELQSSENYVVRIALRDYLELDRRTDDQEPVRHAG